MSEPKKQQMLEWVKMAGDVDRLVEESLVALYKIKEMADMGMPGALSIFHQLSAVLAPFTEKDRGNVPVFNEEGHTNEEKP